MPKHMKAVATLHADRKTATVHVTSTHQNRNFSAKGRSHAMHHEGCYKHKSVVLIYNGYENCYWGFDNYLKDTVLYLIFGDRSDVEIKAEYWPLIKEAVGDYNKWGATQE